MTSKPGRRVFELAMNGDTAAQAEITQAVRGFARHICHGGGPSGAPEVDWEDVAQDSLRKVFTVGVRSYRGLGSERSYLYSLVKTTVIEQSRSAHRRRMREQVASSEGIVPPHNPGLRLDVEMILKLLPEDCRRLIELAFLHGEPYPRLAAALGMAESSVRSKLSRCIARARSLSSEDAAS